MKFQSWPLGDKHIFFMFHVGVIPRGERARGLLVALALHQLLAELGPPGPLPTRTSSSKALEKFALGKISEQEGCSAWSLEGSAPCALGSGLLLMGKAPLAAPEGFSRSGP